MRAEKDNILVNLSLLWGVSTLALLPAGIFTGVYSGTFIVLFALQVALFALLIFHALYLLYDMARARKYGALHLVLVGGFFTSLLIVEGLHPITSRDALIHHLAVPKMWVEAGRIAPIPWHEWSYYPMLLNLAFTGLVAAELPKLSFVYSLGLLICSSAMVGLLAVRLFQKKELALLAATIFFTIPNCLSLASSPLVDLGLTFFALVAFERIIEWHASQKPWTIVQVGAAIGLLLGTKYNGIAFALAFVLLMPILFGKGARAQTIGLGAMVLVAFFAFIVFSPWMLKNYLWTGNPLYPLYGNFFSGSLEPGAVSGLSSITHRRVIYQESWLTILATPLRMIFLGRDGDPRLYDGVLSPLLIFFVAAFARFKREPWVRYGILLIACYFAFALLGSSWRIRYLSPIFGIVALVACYGLAILSQYLRRWGVALILCAQLGWSVLYQWNLMRRSDALAYVRGNIDDRDYLTKHLKEYHVIERINASLPAESKVYLLQTSNAFYYYNVDYFSGGYFSEGPLIKWLREARTSEELREQFQKRGITHILGHKFRIDTGVLSVLTDSERARMAEFETRYLRVLFREDAYVCFQLT